MALFEVILISIIGLFACGLFVWFIFGRKNEEKGSDAFLMLQKQLEDIRNTMDSKLGESSKVMQRQFGESAKIVRDVTERLTKLDETNRQVLNFSDQLKNLQDILKNPKQRGVLGEYYLEETLKNVLPPNS